MKILRRCFRMSRHTYHQFYQSVRHLFVDGHSPNGKSLTLDEILLPILLFFGGNERYLMIWVCISIFGCKQYLTKTDRKKIIFYIIKP